ncbi:MAG: hypothetical protein U5O39_04390 [Gammaproteobacteria bacterium]|nr:hypothetical protein [Gammaproteobacteria bacterium]
MDEIPHDVPHHDMPVSGRDGGRKGKYCVWIDEDGVTNYSEHNPQGVDATYVGPGQPAEASRRPGGRPGAVEDTPNEDDEAQQANAGNAESEAQSAEGGVDPDELVEEERAAIEQKIAERQRENCEIGKRNLTRLQAYARIRVQGEDGQERVLTEEEKQQRIQRARQTVRENCNQGG